MIDLHDRIAVVTGASRGAGRGIALELAEAGAIIYVTGRSTSGGERTEGLPGTVEETAEMITARGGTGIAVRCDHTVDADVEALFARIGREQGRLDILVNNVWGGYEHYDTGHFTDNFWDLPMRHWHGMFESGVRAHLLASRLATPLMLPQRRGLIANTTAWDHDKYLGNLFYDVAKAAVSRMVYGMAKELRSHNIAAIALAPGFMRTERVMAEYEKQPFDLSATETPAYVGRTIVALAGDPNVLEKSGRTMMVGEVAPEYGVTDIDGRQVPPFYIPGE